MPRTFAETITDAVRSFAERGYVSEDQLEDWLSEIEAAAHREATPDEVVREALNRTLRGIYERLVDRDGLLKRHTGVSRFTLQRVRPQLRAELDRRILASANLIKLNRQEAISETLRRFSGWATSIPRGGSEAVKKNPVKSDIRKSLAQLPFRERRVLVDQGHKFTASLNNILAVDGGAIAVVWHSHYRQAGYDYRPDHKARDGKVYMLRGNWAQERGLAKVGPDGYYDQITSVGEEPMCRCYATFAYNLRDLPPEMLTAKGKEELERFRVKVA